MLISVVELRAAAWGEVVGPLKNNLPIESDLIVDPIYVVSYSHFRAAEECTPVTNVVAGNINTLLHFAEGRRRQPAHGELRQR